MSKHLNELCCLLIESLHGELASHIFSTLLTHGRLSLNALIPRAGLHPRYLKHGLAILLQQDLVSYYSPEDEDVTFYEVNVRHAYNLVRIGKNVKLVEDRLGKDAGDMMTRLQVLGYGRIDEVRDGPSLRSNSTAVSDAQSNGTHTNGIAKAARQKRKYDEETMRQLCTVRFAAQVRDIDFLPESDLHDRAERIVMKEEFSGEVKGTKQTKLLYISTIKKKRAWADDCAVKYPTSRSQASGMAASNGEARKRRKLNNGNRRIDDSSDEESDSEEEIVEEEETASPLDAVLIRVNHDKLEVSLRSQLLANLCARRLGSTTATVYLALLRLLERNIPRCHDEYVDEEAEDDDDEGEDTSILNTLPTATTLDVVDAIDPSADLTLPNPAEKKSSKAKRQASEDPDEFPAMNGAQENGTSTRKLDRQARIALVTQHLQLIREDAAKLVLHVGIRQQGEWKVNFPALTRDLIQTELENIFAARFGPLANRIVRILHARGKLDEKQVGTVGLIRQKDLRAKLSAMQEAGYVDTQEVPRDNSRQPSRTIYLWFFDQDRCRNLVLNDAYKIMSRLLQRVRVEREKVHSVIEKSERTDVRGHEDEYLSKAEKDALAEFRDKEERLLAQVGRQDDLIALMRDFLPFKLS